MGRYVDDLAVARHQRHAVLALRHQHSLAIRKLHRVLRGIGDVLFGVGAAAGGFGEFPAIGRQQRRAAIDREIRALGIDYHALVKPARAVDDVSDHARRQHALGVVGQQHDIRARQKGQDGVDQLLLDLHRGRRGHFPVRAQHVGGEMLGDEAHLSRGRLLGITNQHAFDETFLRKPRLQFRAGLVLADHPDENTARAERGDVAGHVAGAADVALGALDRDNRRGRFRRNPGHLAVDEFVEHEVSDAEHRLADNRMRKGIKIEHRNSLSVAGHRKRSARSRKPVTYVSTASSSVVKPPL